ncbi:eukaryotic translation initiation factor 5 [Paramarasmius palmivorus]|uniref:Eukaryotic translation initiation factor 5 n=1 Tax=Paramarasmius palmivorus TaxID=297713 RepID=A0AAW0DE70_9AGAR
MASAGIVNIRRDVDDKFYRYRMPLLTTKIEGKGNGIKTVIPNMADVARALSRPPTYPTKFFGCELGAQTSFDEKNERYIVNGAHDANRLRELLDGFIDKFVLCKSCKNPETELVILKQGRNENIIRDCKACGERTDIDMRHKLTTFILKNPPVKAKKGRKKDAGNAASGVGGGGDRTPEEGDADGADAGGESDDELTRKIKAEAKDLNADTALAKEDWSADTSPEAVKQRIKALEGGLAGVSITNGGDDEGSDDDANSPYGQLGRWVEENHGEDDDTKAFLVSVYKKAEELGIDKKHKTVLVLAQALFTENVVAEIPKYAPLFAKTVTSEKHQKSLLGGIERLVGLSHPELIPSVPKILMAFYQSDILEEEVVTQWGTHVSKKYVDKETSKKVRKASEPFLKWLEEADDDDDDDDEE